MVKDNVKEYFKKVGKATVSQVQLEFSLQYGEARTVFAQLEQEGFISLQDDLYYVCRFASPLLRGGTQEARVAENESVFISQADLKRLKIELEERPELYTDVVVYCTKHTAVSKFDFQQCFNLSDTLSEAIIHWLIRMKVIERISSLSDVNPEDEGTPRKVLLSEKQYEAMCESELCYEDYEDYDYYGEVEDRTERDKYYMAMWKHIMEELDKDEEDGDDGEGDGGDCD